MLKAQDIRLEKWIRALSFKPYALGFIGFGA